MQLVVPLALWAIAQAPLAGAPKEKAAEEGRRGLPSQKADCPEATDFGGTVLERAAFCRAREDKYADARTLAEQALRDNPKSIHAHFVMGLAQHHGEGNLPKALHYLQTAEQLFVDRYGERPGRMTKAVTAYRRTLIQLIYVHGEMDHHEEKIRYVDALSERLGVDYQPLKAWPLLKLKRFEESRLIAKQAAMSDEYWNKAVGATALCAVESELRNRDAAYEACKEAARPVMRSKWDGAIELSNAGAAAEEMFAFDEAERLFLDATKRRSEGSVNPWGRLVRLYLRQGRLSEAVSAWREMKKYRAARQASYLNQQDEAEAEMIGTSILMIAGLAEEAATASHKTVSRPDRQGTSSAASDQNEAGAAIVDVVARRMLARRLEEDASTAELWEAVKLRAAASQLRVEAWAVERQAAEILANRERLVTSLRPECPGSLELPSFLDAEIIRVVGPGIALAAIAEGRKEETLPAEFADQVFLALEAEAYLLKGDEETALAKAKEGLALLPSFEVLHRARLAAVAAEAAKKEGLLDEALGFYRIALGGDPGVIRRLGMTLPVQLTAGATPAAKEATELLEDSPLFEETSWGFSLTVSESEAVLREADGSDILRMRVPKGRAENVEAAGRRIARAVHADLLVPNVDITQADIRSLDGSLGSGGKASDRVKSIMDEVLEQPAQ